jgi:purine-binding chemotaxis protein CheW
MAADELELLLFTVAEQRYALPARDVEEVVRAVASVPLPKAPAVIEGIINLRGAVVPVLDLRVRFRLPPRAVQPADHLIIARAGRRRVALRVDRALELARLAAEPAPEVQGADYVSGVVMRSDGLVLIHDLRTFLSSAEAATLEEALTSSAGGPP